MNLKDIDVKILCELTKNPRANDRQLSKILGVPQQTVSRHRSTLEKEKLIEYAVIPNLQKLGFQILAFTFAEWKRTEFPDEKVAEARIFLSKHPSFLFVSTGSGRDADRVAVTVHKDYGDYLSFMRELRQDWGAYMDGLGSFIVSLNSDKILRDLAFKSVANLLMEETKSES